MSAEVEKRQGMNVADVAKVYIFRHPDKSSSEKAHTYVGIGHPSPNLQ